MCYVQAYCQVREVELRTKYCKLIDAKTLKYTYYIGSPLAALSRRWRQLRGCSVQPPSGRGKKLPMYVLNLVFFVAECAASYVVVRIFFIDMHI